MSEIWMLKKTGGGILKFLLIICIKTSFCFIVVEFCLSLEVN